MDMELVDKKELILWPVICNDRSCVIYPTFIRESIRTAKKLNFGSEVRIQTDAKKFFDLRFRNVFSEFRTSKF